MKPKKKKKKKEEVKEGRVKNKFETFSKTSQFKLLTVVSIIPQNDRLEWKLFKRWRAKNFSNWARRQFSY